ncbi:MAG: calcium:proton antiporter [Rhodoglobus sp.]
MTITKTPTRFSLKSWPFVVPVVGFIALAFTLGSEPVPLVAAALAIVLTLTVLAAVHHAEVIAHKVGEPFGSLVLAVSVTVIEVALIIALMLSGGPETATLARDTVFAAVMITMNGILGISLAVGGLRHGIVRFNPEGAGALVATVTALAVLGLVLPTFTSAPGPAYSPAQLAFAAVASLTIYGMFVATQTVRHRDFFLPVASNGKVLKDDDHAVAPTTRAAWLSVGFLLVSLATVVGLAKVGSPSIEAVVASAELPQSFVGVVIALVVLLPESIAAVRYAARNRVQTSINLALGSAVASIGLTIPALAVATIFITGPLKLGLGPTQIVLLVLTLIVTVLSVVPGRATRLQGGIHLVIFAAFIFLSMFP